MTEHKNVITDFANRTKRNLIVIENTKELQSDFEIYEVTQLINSLLGLLVFPREHYINTIPKIPMSELATKGWPIPRVTGSFPQVENLRDLVRYMRNAIAHFNLDFIVDENKEITGIRLWNCKNGKRGTKNWEGELDIHELRDVVFRFIELITGDDIHEVR